MSYADFITLLFAFFVVLYASWQVDKRRVGRLALAIQVAFQELGVFETSNTRVPLSDTEAIPFSKVQAVENVDRSSELDRLVEPMKGILAPTDSGSATMRASSLQAMDRLAHVIVPRTENLRIEGHTDNVPIHNSHFSSNWELSTARATELVRLFIVRYHVEPNRLSASGYAEFHPVDDNATSEGRAHNRRVDIVILNPALQEKSPFATPAAVPQPPGAAPNISSVRTMRSGSSAPAGQY